MESVSVPWRPSGGKSKSGGRGEFEYVPAASLEGKEINVFFEALNLTIPAEVRGVNEKSQGKPRLRKFEPNNRKKLHLPTLVMAVARLPEFRREDHHIPLVFPLENKSFVMNAMDFDIIDDDGITITLAPLRVSILHTDFKVELQDRFGAIARDIAEAQDVAKNYPKLAAAIISHADQDRPTVGVGKGRHLGLIGGPNGAGPQQEQQGRQCRKEHGPPRGGRGGIHGRSRKNLRCPGTMFSE